MEERKEDPTIYLVSTIFFAFIISGGIFLCLYIFLPTDQIKNWYPTVGLTLIAIPWAFWFFTYIYRCIRLRIPPPQHPKSYPADPQPAAQSEPTSSDDYQSAPGNSSDGAPRVHFVGVVVVNEDENKNNGERQNDDDDGAIQNSCVEQDQSSNGTTSHENSITSRESEVPLTHNHIVSS